MLNALAAIELADPPFLTRLLGLCTDEKEEVEDEAIKTQ